MDGWMDGQASWLTDRQMDDIDDGCTDRQVNRWIDRRIKYQIDR